MLSVSNRMLFAINQKETNLSLGNERDFSLSLILIDLRKNLEIVTELEAFPLQLI